MAVKQHFTNDKYDFFEYKGRVKNCTAKALVAKPYYFVMCKLANTYDAKGLRDYFVSNMLVSEGKHIFDVDNEGLKIYNEYIRRRDSRTYLFKKDVDKVCKQLEKMGLTNFWDSVKVESQTHPLLFRLFVGSYISPETMALLYKIRPYVDDWDTKITDTILYPSVAKQIKKLAPFIMVKNVSPFSDYITEVNQDFFTHA